MTGSNALGEYLRARRELVDPADVGLPVVGVRRTPGLRREEVATLAGISSDYYLRLEQGRDHNPSPKARRCGCGTRERACWSCAARSCPSATPAASSW